MERRHKSAFGVLEAMGGFAPTMGIIGTVMGLVNVLENLDKPGELGTLSPRRSSPRCTALARANLFWLPLGAKLKQQECRGGLAPQLMVEGILAVQAGDNPRVVREKLEAQLPPAGVALRPPAPPPRPPGWRPERRW